MPTANEPSYAPGLRIARSWCNPRKALTYFMVPVGGFQHNEVADLFGESSIVSRINQEAAGGAVLWREEERKTNV